MHSDDDVFDRGLSHDLSVLQGRQLERRVLLKFAVAAGLLPALGCGTDSSPSDGEDIDSPAGTDAGTCSKIPEETAGPYPGDGSNGPNALTRSGIVRSDIRSSIAGSATAAGVPLTLTLTIVDSTSGCTPLAGHAVYAWHCDRDGKYSLYSSGITNEDYLRGVQQTDADGKVTFTTIYPGCYSGRWPHIHFEVYPSLAAATSASNVLATSQVAMPEVVSDAVYEVDGYESSVSNFARISLSSDNVFRDGSDSQLPACSGNTEEGFVAELTVGVAS